MIVVIMMNNLKLLRNEKDLSTQALSKILNINHTTLNRLENGVTSLNEDYIKIFCKFYNVTSDYLLGLSDIKNDDNSKVAIPLYSFTDYDNGPLYSIMDYLPDGTSLENIFFVDIPNDDFSLYPFLNGGSRVLISKIPVNNKFQMCYHYVTIKGQKIFAIKYYLKINDAHCVFDEFDGYKNMLFIKPQNIIGFVKKIIVVFSDKDNDRIIE